MYTGGMENKLATIRAIAGDRSLWGNGARALRIVRNPAVWRQLAEKAGLLCPAVEMSGHIPRAGRWLAKPLAGAGGAGIRFVSRSTDRLPAAYYLQQYMEGDSYAAAYVANGRSARLLGITRQLVGQNWLGAAPFHYCGSIGPLFLSPAIRSALERFGNVLTVAAQLRGLFGVDFILHDQTPFPVEINPRYTASMEVLEAGLDVPVVARHAQVFDPAIQLPSRERMRPSVVGKAVLFARRTITFPTAGPWLSVLAPSESMLGCPSLADIPAAGQLIKKKSPILSMFVSAETEADCFVKLRDVAADLDHRLHGA
jgi:predicted ATP-grasp superfamily ATP-dependent carboligase